MNSLRIGIVPLRKEGERIIPDVEQAKWDIEEPIDGKLYADLFNMRVFVGDQTVIVDGEVENSKGTTTANLATADKLEQLLSDYLKLLKDEDFSLPLKAHIKDTSRRIAILITAIDTIRMEREIPEDHELILTVEY